MKDSNLRHSVCKTDALAAELIGFTDLRFGIADLGFYFQSAIPNPKSAIELVDGVGIAPTSRRFQRRANLPQLTVRVI